MQMLRVIRGFFGDRASGQEAIGALVNSAAADAHRICLHCTVNLTVEVLLDQHVQMMITRHQVLTRSGPGDIAQSAVALGVGDQVDVIVDIEGRFLIDAFAALSYFVDLASVNRKRVTADQSS
jgi:hypothetical protein